MARANAANDIARAQFGDESTLEQMSAAVQSSAFSLGSPGLARVFNHTVIVCLLIFTAGLSASLWFHLQARRSQALTQAFATLDVLTDVIALEAERAPLNATSPSPAKAPSMTLPGQVTQQGRHVLISDADGKIIVSVPSANAFEPQATELLAKATSSKASLANSNAQASGSQSLVLSNGVEILFSQRDLASPFGTLIVYQPIQEALADWQESSVRLMGLIAALGLVTLTLILVYWRQSVSTKETMQSFDQLNNRINTALTRGHCGLWDWDLATGRIHWSASMFEMLGQKPQTGFLSVADINQWRHPDEADLSHIAACLLDSETRTIDHEFRLRHRSGQWIWIRARAELVQRDRGGYPRMVGIAIDVTEQKSIDAMNATAEMRLHDAVEAISEAFVVWDRDNRLVLCNSKFQHLHDLPAEFVQPGISYDEIMQYSAQSHIEMHIPDHHEQSAHARAYEVLLTDGRWLQVNERRTKDGGYVSVGTDITKIKQHEEQLMNSERRLMATVADLKHSRNTLETQARQVTELAEKYLEQKAEAEIAYRAKSEFLSNMSHELRTPLNAIIGFSEIMAEETFGALGSAKYIEYCRHIRQSGQALLAIISDVLDMSRLETGRLTLNRKEVWINDEIAKAVHQVRASAQDKNIQIHAMKAEDISTQADPGALGQVLTKILRNAIRFTPEQGNVMVHQRAFKDQVCIYVCDNGIGIPPSALARLGRPFEQIDTPLENGCKGSGLGLAIARALIELHGGSLKIKSAMGAGTIVRIRLPLTIAEDLSEPLSARIHELRLTGQTLAA